MRKLKLQVQITVDGYVGGPAGDLDCGYLATAINKLKSKRGKDMIVYGGAGFVSSLIREGLIDEFNIFVNPILINKGLRIFDLLEHRQKLSPVSAKAYACGISVLVFKLDPEG